MVTRRIGHPIVHFDQTNSTNEDAWRRSGLGLNDGLVVLAEHQTAGRGRLGRSWLAPRGAGVLASALLVDEQRELSGPVLSIVSAVAARDSVVACTGVHVDLEWPNDLCVGARKLGGVLVESRVGADGHRRFVVGIGINCLQQPGHFDDSLSRTATSLEIESELVVNRSMIALRLLEELDGWLAGPIAWSASDARDAWLARCRTLGRRIHLRHDGRDFRGHVVDLDPTSALIVELDGGGRRAFAVEHTTVIKA